MADTDQVAAVLDHIRQELEMASEVPMPTAPRRVVKVHALALLSAVDKVLALHFVAPVQVNCERCRSGPHCARCGKSWPCRDGEGIYSAILAGLTGEGSDGT